MKVLELLNKIKNSKIDFGYLDDAIEAIKELEDLQNRSCENCKYEKLAKNKCAYGINGVKYNFCCNKWESK